MSLQFCTSLCKSVRTFRNKFAADLKDRVFLILFFFFNFHSFRSPGIFVCGSVNYQKVMTKLSTTHPQIESELYLIRTEMKKWLHQRLQRVSVHGRYRQFFFRSSYFKSPYSLFCQLFRLFLIRYE